MISDSNDSQLYSKNKNHKLKTKLKIIDAAFSIASTQPVSSMLNTTQNFLNTKNYDSSYATIPIHIEELSIYTMNSQLPNKKTQQQQTFYNSPQIHEIEALITEGPKFKNYQPMEIIDFEPRILHSSKINNKNYMLPPSDPLIFYPTSQTSANMLNIQNSSILITDSSPDLNSYNNFEFLDKNLNFTTMPNKQLSYLISKNKKSNEKHAMPFQLRKDHPVNMYSKL